MQPGDKPGVVSGDVFVFDGDKLVALCGGLYFHKMTKKVLRIIFEQGGHAPAKKAAPAKVVTQKAAAPIKQQPQAVHTETSKEKSLPDSDESSAYDSSGSGTVESSAPSSVNNDDEPDVAEALLAIIAAESGFDASDMDSSTEFADMGLDSLMSIAIISAAKRDIDLELPATFFTDNATVGDIRKEFGKAPAAAVLAAVATAPAPIQVKESPAPVPVPVPAAEPVSAPTPASVQRVKSAEYMANDPEPYERLSDIETPGSSGTSSPAPERVTMALPVKSTIPPPKSKQVVKSKPAVAAKPDLSQYTSNVVLIRGKRSSKETPLMLITDGAGSAAAYIHLPAMKTGTPIYALESPFLKDPHAYECSVEEVCALYVKGLKKTQPHGPYIVGGWSAGAVYAYEVTRQLLEAGDKLLGLILIDMRVPKAMPDALEPSVELIESAGLFTGVERAGQAETPQAMRLKQHLVSTVKALVFYTPRPVPEGNLPAHTTLIWAQKGLSEAGKENVLELPAGEGSTMAEEHGEANMGQDGTEDPETGMKSWFFAKRNAFGPNGWDRLVRGKVDCHVIDGADHFSMVVPPKVCFASIPPTTRLLCYALLDDDADGVFLAQVKVLGQILEGAVRKFIADAK